MTDQALDAGTATDRDGRGATAAPGSFRRPAGPRPGPPSVFSGLPPCLPHFQGRRRELAGLRADIDRPGLGASHGGTPESCRVLLVAGRPGTGRTALAVRLAHDVADRYPDARLFASLTTGTGQPVPAGRTARALLRALGAQPGPDFSEDELTSAFRDATAGRRVVLVLDDVNGSDQLLPLLPEGPGSLVVATSRGPLSGVVDVRPCILGGLDTEASVALLSRAIGSTRVTCDPTAADTLAAACEGHPTALRLVAAWLAERPRMSVSDAVRLLDDIPRDGPSAAPAPLTRAFRLLHDSLPPRTARTLRLLAVAPAGVVDAHVASALIGHSVGSAQATLDELTGYGLLEPEPVTSPLPPQYRVPGCLEPFLRDLLTAEERPAELRLARARMLERTVRLLHACRISLEPDGERAALDGLPKALRFPSRVTAAVWLRLRLPALLAAARTAVEDGGFDTLARRLVAALVHVLALSPDSGEAAAERYQLYGLVLDVAERRGLHREKAAALISLAELDAGAGRTRQALARYRTALDAAREGGDGDTVGRSLEAIAGSYLELGDPQRACDWYGRALVVRQGQGELGHQARLHSRLGALHLHGDRPGDALREWRAAASAQRRLRDLPALARALSEVARAQEHAGCPEEALRTCREALGLARTAGERRLEGTVLLRMAGTLDRLGDPAGAQHQRAAAEQLIGVGELPAG